MTGRWRRHTRGARPGLTLIELLIAIAVLAVLGALLLSRHPDLTRQEEPPPAASEAPEPPSPPAAPVVLPVPDQPPAPTAYGMELSLQETLDRLGFTVNVPRIYHGHSIADARGYRTSTRDDSMAVERFECRGEASFQELSRQASLAGVTSFVIETASGNTDRLLEPASSPKSPWLSRDAGATAVKSWRGPANFSLDFDGGGFGAVPLSSIAGDNPGGESALLVLPARTGGEWVDDGRNTGHWEGGSESGAYLLCWEDLPRSGSPDYQDLVILARGIQPVSE